MRPPPCPDGLDGIEGSTAASLVTASADSIEPRCSQPAPSGRRTSAREGPKNWPRHYTPRSRTTTTRHPRRFAPPRVGKSRVGLWCEALSPGASLLFLRRFPPPAPGAPPPPRLDPPSTAAALLSVRLGRHRATGADPATASRQTDPTWQPPPQATTPPAPTTSAVLTTVLETLGCELLAPDPDPILLPQPLNACEVAICRADKPRARRLFRGKEFAVRSSGPSFVRDAVSFQLFTLWATTPPHPAQATRRHALVASKPKSSGPLCSSRSSQCGQLLLLPLLFPSVTFRSDVHNQCGADSHGSSPLILHPSAALANSPASKQAKIVSRQQTFSQTINTPTPSQSKPFTHRLVPRARHDAAAVGAKGD